MMAPLKAPNATNQQVKKLRKLADEGLTLYEAAEAMLWPFQRIQYWEKRLNVRFARGRRRVLTEREIGKLRECAQKGLSLDGTAARMRWGRNKVWYWEKRLDIEFTRVRKPANGI